MLNKQTTKQMGRTKTMVDDEQPTVAPNFKMVAKINEKIQKTAQDIGKMAKDGKNTHSNYSYISNVQMVGAMRDKLLPNKLSIVPSVVEHSEREVSTKHSMAIRSTVTMAFEITDLETGYSMIESFVGSEQDTGGKSMQQAITQCCKYFYFKLFNVSSQDEIDGDDKTEHPPETPKVKKLTKQQVDNIIAQSDEYKVEVCNKIESKQLVATTAQYNQIKQSINL